MAQPSRFWTAALAVLLLPAPASSQDHLVTSEDLQARFAAIAEERGAHVRTLEAALAKPVLAEAAAVAHIDLDRLRARVPRLTDQELRDLAARSKSLNLDPEAGDHPAVLVLAVIGAAALLLLIILLIALGSGTYD